MSSYRFCLENEDYVEIIIQDVYSVICSFLVPIREIAEKTFGFVIYEKDV